MKTVLRVFSSFIIMSFTFFVGLTVPVARASTSSPYSLATFPVAASSITTGSDGAIWFANQAANSIGRISVAGESVEYPLSTPNSYPEAISAGPNGAIWFTTENSMIGQVSTLGEVSEYPLTSIYNSYIEATGITQGPDGALWFAGHDGGRAMVGRITTAGDISEYLVPVPAGASGGLAHSIIAGPDGALWFDYSYADSQNVLHNFLGRIDRSGTFSSYYNLPSTSGTYWSGLTVAPDGAFWMVGDNYLWRVTDTGDVQSFLTDVTYGSPVVTTVGADGTMWLISDLNGAGSYMASFSTAGIGSYIQVASAGNASSLTLGPDGALWFASSTIGRFMPDQTAEKLELSPGSQNSSVGNVATFTATAKDANNYPVVGESIIFNVSGKVQTTGACITSMQGACGFSYSGPTTAGTDLVSAFSDNNQNSIEDTGEPQASATNIWVRADTLSLTPTNGVNEVGSVATFTVTATEGTLPVQNIRIYYDYSGTNDGGGDCITDENGQCSFSYSSILPGADTINVNAYQAYSGQPQVTTTQSWLVPTSSPGQVSGAGVMAGPSGTKIAFGFRANGSNNGSPSGSGEVVDPGAKSMIRLTGVSAVVVNGTQATIYGTAIVDGANASYRITVQDNAQPGAGIDTFQIITSTGYSAGGTISKGDVQVN